MRAPTKTERLLLVVFAILMAFLLLLFAWRTLQQRMGGQRSAEAALRTQVEELTGWLGQREIWEERGQWLEENPPPAWEGGSSESDLVQELQQSLAGNGITIAGQRLLGSEPFAGFRVVGIQLSLRGTTEQLVRWLHQTQQPGEFIAIRQLNLRADGDAENLRAEVNLARFYREVDESAAARQVTTEEPQPQPDWEEEAVLEETPVPSEPAEPEETENLQIEILEIPEFPEAHPEPEITDEEP